MKILWSFLLFTLVINESLCLKSLNNKRNEIGVAKDRQNVKPKYSLREDTSQKDKHTEEIIDKLVEKVKRKLKEGSFNRGELKHYLRKEIELFSDLLRPSAEQIFDIRKKANLTTHPRDEQKMEIILKDRYQKETDSLINKILNLIYGTKNVKPIQKVPEQSQTKNENDTLNVKQRSFSSSSSSSVEEYSYEYSYEYSSNSQQVVEESVDVVDSSGSIIREGNTKKSKQRDKNKIKNKKQSEGFSNGGSSNEGASKTKKPSSQNDKAIVIDTGAIKHNDGKTELNSGDGKIAVDWDKFDKSDTKVNNKVINATPTGTAGGLNVGTDMNYNGVYHGDFNQQNNIIQNIVHHAPPPAQNLVLHLELKNARSLNTTKIAQNQNKAIVLGAKSKKDSLASHH